MGYKYQDLFVKIVESVADNGETAERMASVIDECAAQRPHADWSRLRRLDFRADEQKIAGWLSAAFPKAGERALGQGLWFGLFNPIRFDSPSADAYVSAAPDFDDASIEWATQIAPQHPGSYLNSVVLHNIYSIAYESYESLGNDAEYPLVLTYGGIAARAALMRSELPKSLTALRGAAVGFDSGDFLQLGDFADGKFITNVRSC